MKIGTQPFLSVVIVTRNRHQLLRKVLNSLVKQTLLPDEVIVIDNNSTDQTSQVISHFQQKTRLPLRSVTESSIGYPYVYNRGLREAQGKWIAFIDDDCLAHPRWVEEIKRKTTQIPDVSAILGESKTVHAQNIFSLAILISDQYWKKNKISKNRVTDLEILDNKNLVYQAKFLKTHQITFDESRASILGGAAEDCDLGKQIEAAGGTAIYHSKAIVYHHDPTDLVWFCKRYIKSYAAYLTFSQKWPVAQSPAPRYKLKTIMAMIFTEYRSGFFQRMSTTCLLTLTVGTSLLLSKLLKSKTFESRFITFAETL